MNNLPASPAEGQIAESDTRRYRFTGGVWEIVGPGVIGGCIAVHEYTTAGAHTWTKPAGAELIIVELVGGGGGGGGGSRPTTFSYGGMGGGGGSYARFMLPASLFGATAAVSVGAAGTAGASGGGDGGNGGNSTFASSYIAYGGRGGEGSNGGSFGTPAAREAGRGGGYIDAYGNIAFANFATRVNSHFGGMGSLVTDTPNRNSDLGGAGGGEGTATSDNRFGGRMAQGQSVGGEGGNADLNNSQAGSAGSPPGGGGGGGFGSAAGGAGTVGRVTIYTFGKES